MTKKDKKEQKNPQNQSKQPKPDGNKQNNKFFFSIPFILALLIWLLIWIVPIGSPVVDPWYKAVKLVDSAQRVDNANQKIQLLNEGGQKLRELAEKHPYHARVRFFLGYYYFVSQKWDSALTELKEASRIDSGSTINSVWPQAHDLIAKACVNIANNLIQQKNYEKAKNILLDGYKYYPKHPLLNKFLGITYYRLQQFENALRYLMISFSGNPKDDAVANLIGIVYNIQGNKSNARAYFQKAVQLNPNNKAAKMNFDAIQNAK